jgi:hypothetical protein
MKRIENSVIGILIIIYLFAIAISGCSKESTPQTAPKPTQEKEVTATNDLTKETMIPIGSLGYPMGTYLTLEGDMIRTKLFGTTFLISVINGKKPAETRFIDIKNYEKLDLPLNKGRVLNGYESGEMDGIPDEVIEAERIFVAPSERKLWKFDKYFIVTSIVQPNNISNKPMPSVGTRSKETIIPIGKLGYPMGSFLTLEGVATEHPLFMGPGFVVDSVNGRKLASSIMVVVEQNAKSPRLPKGERCIIRGYESGEMIGEPEAVYKAENIQIRSQFGWQFYKCFMVTSVIQPKTLKKD